jgi:hypothetical protein
VDRLTVNHNGTVGQPGSDQRPTPLVLQQGSHLATVPLRWNKHRSAEVSHETENMDGDDLDVGTFDPTVRHERDCPIKRPPRVFGSVDTDDDAARSIHGPTSPGLAASLGLGPRTSCQRQADLLHDLRWRRSHEGVGTPSQLDGDDEVDLNLAHGIAVVGPGRQYLSRQKRNGLSPPIP